MERHWKQFFYSRYGTHLPTDWEAARIKSALRVLRHCRHTKWIAEKIDRDIVDPGVMSHYILYVASKRLDYDTGEPGVTQALIHLWSDEEIYAVKVALAENLLKASWDDRAARPDVAITLWHEHYHFEGGRHEIGANKRGIDLATRLKWCYCEGNADTRREVTLLMLAQAAREAAESGGGPVPKWALEVIGASRRGK